MKLEEESHPLAKFRKNMHHANLVGNPPGALRGMAMEMSQQEKKSKKKKRKQVQKMSMMSKKAAISDSESDEDEQSINDYEDLRKSTRTQFQEAEAATEYCETHYYKNPNVFNPNTVQENPFWVDFANHIIKTGSLNNFVSSNFIFATNGDTQAWSILGLMNLPYESPRQIMKSLGGKGIKITATDNLVLYK